MAKVVILGSAWPLRGGGLATFNERLARAFLDQGHQVVIYTFSLQYPGILFPGKTQYSDEPAPEGLDIRVKVNSINPLSWWKTGRELRRMRPDLLVVRYWIPFMAPCLGTIAALVKQNRHTRVIAIADNIIPHEQRAGDRLLTRYFVRRADGFITMSQAVKRDLMAFGVEEQRVRFCEHPLYDNFGERVPKEQARRQLQLPVHQPLVLFFGFIREYKGLDILLQAMAAEGLRNSGVKLLVAGEFYAPPEKYHTLARELKIEDRVIWHTDFIANEQVRLYFCSADIVAQPYKSATQSGVTQIAYHFEVPMLVTNVGGLPEMVPHGRAGYVVEPEPEAISRALEDFFGGDSRQVLTEGLRREKKRFSWQGLVNSIMDLC